MPQPFRLLRPLGAAGCAFAFGFAATACSGGDLVLPEDGAPATIEMVSGNDQAAPVGTALQAPLIVRVTNQAGEPVEGIRVEWAASAGSVDPAVALTDADGRASTRRVLGATEGTQTATASSGSLDGSPVRFTHAAVPADDGGGNDGDGDDEGGGGGNGGGGGDGGGGGGGDDGGDNGGGDGDDGSGDDTGGDGGGDGDGKGKDKDKGKGDGKD